MRLLGDHPHLWKALLHGGATLRPQQRAAADLAAPVQRAQGTQAQQVLEALASQFEPKQLEQWVPKALSWVRQFCWSRCLIPKEHPAHPVLDVVAGIVEQASSDEPVNRLCSSNVQAHREGNLWWLSIT